MHDAQQGHLRRDQGIGRGADFVEALEQELPEAVELPGGEATLKLAVVRGTEERDVDVAFGKQAA